ncbi:hypothetical protein OG589_24370 [Sphaerisporangium sp. NBC_01403]|uniref:hypothetical protein n=1 Tax=Sphaerisporangium sp. NBC_01403 TaxID=2903599 RepID=UPI00324FD50D
MFEKVVGVHLFRLQDVFHLSRTRSVSQAAAVDPGAPAILVIPREGPLREPHLMLFTGARNFCAMPSGTLVSEGVHVVVRLGDGLEERWCEVADVVVGVARCPYAFAAQRVTRILDRHPGCEVATGRRRRGCLAGLRDGRLAKIAEVAGAGHPGAAMYGSFLYGWLVAGIPLGCLATASVVHGRYIGSAAGGPGSLEVAGRAQIRMIDPGRGRAL